MDSSDTITNNVDFGVNQRIGYYLFAPGELGNLSVPDDNDSSWNLNDFTGVVHQYGGKADLVISKNRFRTDFQATSGLDTTELDGGEESRLLLVKSFVLLNMVDEIVNAVVDNGFDGVTIDFDGMTDFEGLDAGVDSEETIESYKFFIKRLRNRLTEVDEDRFQVSVVIPSMGIDANDVVELADFVDRFLIDNSKLDTISDALRESRKEGKIENIVVQIFDNAKDATDEINSTSGIDGGVGFWLHDFMLAELEATLAVTPEGTVTAAEKESTDVTEKNVTDIEGLFALINNKNTKSAFEKDLDPYICPRTTEIGYALSGVLFIDAVLALIFLVSFGSRRFIKNHFRIALALVIALAIVTLLLFWSLVLFSPGLDNVERPIMITFFVVVAIIFAWQLWTNRKKSDYP